MSNSPNNNFNTVALQQDERKYTGGQRNSADVKHCLSVADFSLPSDDEGEETTNFETPACIDVEENLCSVCMQWFRTRFSRRKQKWMLVDAVRLEGMYYHPLCIKDTWNNTPADKDKPLVLSVNVSLS